MDFDAWVTVKKKFIFSTHLVDGVVENESREGWFKENKENVHYNLKAKLIINIALGMNGFFFLCFTS